MDTVVKTTGSVLCIMDHAKQLNKFLRKNQKDTQYILTRELANNLPIERVLDVLDAATPFEIRFEVPVNRTWPIILDLEFKAVGSASNCAGYICAQCNFYTHMADNVLVTNHDFLSGSVRVFKNDFQTTSFTESPPNEIILGFTPIATDYVKVCYLWAPWGQV